MLIDAEYLDETRVVVTKNNEIKYARIVAKKYNTEHYELIEQTKDLEKIAQDLIVD